VSRLKPTIKEIFRTDPATRDAATQEEFERNFYSRLRLANGVYKTTHTRRFDDLNLLINDLLPRGRRLELLDVGISSGISTMEWLDALRAAGIDAHVVGGDLDIVGYLVSVGGSLDLLIDRNGYMLQMDLGSRSITNRLRHPRLRQTLLAAPMWCLNTAVGIFWWLSPTLRRHVAANGGELELGSGIRCSPLSVLSPRLRADPAIEVIEDDIVANTERFCDRFDVIRAANVLNWYLDADMLVRMFETLRRRLRVGGLLVLCRTDLHERNRGTIFRMDGSRQFEVVQRINGGSEIERFVLSGGDPAVLRPPITRS
jgi:hypothetical protein